MRSLRRWTKDTVGLLLVFTIVGLSRVWPPRWMLRRIAASAEVRAEREAAEEKLLTRVREIEAGVSWLRPLDVVIHDECVDVRGAGLFDANPPRRGTMTCEMSAYIIFSTDGEPEDAAAEIHRSFPLPDGLSTDGIAESLHWDTDERKVALDVSHNPIWDRVTRRHGEKSVEQLRRENGVLFMWALHQQAYWTVV